MARVLIVDDDPWIRSLLEEVLRDEGYQVRSAADGHEALSAARSWHPHLILMDLMLPQLDGATAIRILRADDRARRARIVAMSAGVNLRERAPSLPVDGVLGKPFDLDALLADVAVQVRQALTATPRQPGLEEERDVVDLS
ncbi:MAG: response regulator [Thermomicrobiaceae bacterium]|nr:response regulator [Thermomicrobiaceae bacterium]